MDPSHHSWLIGYRQSIDLQWIFLGGGPGGEPYALIISYSDVVGFLKSSETDPVIRLVLITIGVETEYISVSRSLSGWGTKWEPNALFAVESEIVELLRLLTMIRWSVSSIIAIGIESKYRSIARSRSRWGTKRSPMPQSPLRARSWISWDYWSWFSDQTHLW
jgi:hypothetical protein